MLSPTFRIKRSDLIGRLKTSVVVFDEFLVLGKLGFFLVVAAPVTTESSIGSVCVCVCDGSVVECGCTFSKR